MKWNDLQTEMVWNVDFISIRAFKRAPSPDFKAIA
jgi:hypothetical protein